MNWEFAVGCYGMEVRKQYMTNNNYRRAAGFDICLRLDPNSYF